jgi:tetratricopeptide (TPR) repeat protein
MRRAGIAALVLAALFAGMEEVSCQDRPAEIKEALFLENQSDYDTAFELYMKYENAHRGSREALAGMGRTAKRIERTEEYRRILAARFDELPGDRDIARMYVQALYNSGERGECERVGRECVRRWPAAPDIYTSICTLYRSNAMTREAMEVLLAGRRSLGNEDLFRRDMAELLFTTGDFPASVREFLAYYRKNQRSTSYVGKWLRDAASELGDVGRVTSIVEEESRGELCGSVLPLLIDLEMTAGAYESALDRVLSCRERQPDRVAEELTRLARVSMRNGEEEVAKKAVEEAVDFAGAAKPEVKIQLAEELGRMGKGEEALPLLEAALEAKIPTQSRMRCYELLGDLFLETRLDPRQALEWYRKLEAEGMPPARMRAVSLKLSHALIEAGELESARTELARLAEATSDAPQRGEILFELANSYLYGGLVEDALSTYRKLIEQLPGFPRASEAIDALRLEKSYGEEGTEALAAIGRAQYAERRGRTSDARREYAGALEKAGTGPLSGEVGLLFAGFLSRSGSTGEALSLYESVKRDGGEDYLEARALTEMGRVYYFTLHDRAAAQAALEEVVLRYGDVVETEEARRLLAEIAESS